MGLPQSDGQLTFGVNFMSDPPDLQDWFGIASMGGVFVRVAGVCLIWFSVLVAMHRGGGWRPTNSALGPDAKPRNNEWVGLWRWAAH